MPHMTDYAVLRDGFFDLSSGQDFQLPGWDPPSDFLHHSGFQKPIIMWKARPLPNAPFSTQATINLRHFHSNTSIDTVTIRGDTVHGLWETFSGNLLGDVVLNVFSFRCTSGRVRISDVILWYQRNI